MPLHDCQVVRPAPVELQVRVPDITAVQRTLGVLRTRQHRVTRFAAQEVADGCWQVDLALAEPSEHLELLLARLSRLPDVLRVDVLAPRVS